MPWHLKWQVVLSDVKAHPASRRSGVASHGFAETIAMQNSIDFHPLVQHSQALSNFHLHRFFLCLMQNTFNWFNIHIKSNLYITLKGICLITKSSCDPIVYVCMDNVVLHVLESLFQMKCFRLMTLFKVGERKHPDSTAADSKSFTG